jgi:hypothetical protein
MSIETSLAGKLRAVYDPVVKTIKIQAGAPALVRAFFRRIRMIHEITRNRASKVRQLLPFLITVKPWARTVQFADFVKVGTPLTVICAVVVLLARR